jgi:hypothetical protein
VSQSLASNNCLASNNRKRRGAEYRGAARKRQTARGRQSDSQARERARAYRDGNQIEISRTKPCFAQRRLDHRRQYLRMTAREITT